jgi:hypothetical protein
MTTKIVCEAGVPRLSIKTGGLLLILISVAIAGVGCGGPYYASGPGPGPGYAGPGPYYGSGYAGSGPYYGGSSASVVVAVGDRPYYTHGPGYYVGRTYYAWRPGHVSHRGRWIPGHYVLVRR